ncbi:MAG: rhomboid family intramembrane serine protease, partial [Erysipelotrichaceae bacterium]|nr:rhomboid family intramembrane serine protease [Erysipelotrichaceae bacterium]
MSEQSNIYKLYQVMGYLSLSHGYRGVLLKGNVHRDEIWLVNRENKTYEIIRITMASLESVDYDRERIRQCIHAIASQVQIRDPRFLDIHIGKGEVLDNEAFDTLCLDIGYQNGIDVSAVYPGLRNVIHHVDDPNAEIKQIFEEVNRNALNIRKNRRRFFKKDNICTVILLIVTLAVFAVSVLLSMRYERSSVLVLLGADYKTFTLGLKQYWRLLSSMLVHGSFYHIFANSYSLYFLGSYIERQYGHG